jgi:hypothetical protein
VFAVVTCTPSPVAAPQPGTADSRITDAVFPCCTSKLVSVTGRIIRGAMKPPFRKGIDPLIECGIVEKPSDSMWKFLWFCERLYLENIALRNALADAGLDPKKVLRRDPARVGSPGFHRGVFDKLVPRHSSRSSKAFCFSCEESESQKICKIELE